MTLQHNISLQDRHFLGLRVKADYFQVVTTIEELISALDFAGRESLPVTVLGEGSNVVLTEDLPGVVIVNGIKGIRHDRDLTYVGAGENWHQFVTLMVSQQRFGIENLALIPGTVGAAPIQNIGAYGVEMSEVCQSVTAVHAQSGETRSFSAEECEFDYRDSRFKREPGWIVTEVCFSLDNAFTLRTDYPDLAAHFEGVSRVTGQMVFDAVVDIRKRKLPDPVTHPNVGSFFKNPVVNQAQAKRLEQEFNVVGYPFNDGIKVSAAKLIDLAGLKGCRVGGFAVSEQHALVLVNLNSGSVSDLLELVQEIKERVKERYGIELEPEPQFFP